VLICAVQPNYEVTKNMSDHIPIITGEEAGGLTKKVYGDSGVIRVPLDRSQRLTAFVPPSSKLWIDPCVDGCDDIETRRSKPGEKNNSWFDFMNKLPNFEKLGQPSFCAKPPQAEVTAFVKALMNQCAARKPAWITVPQLPIANGNDRNKINRSLAQAAGKWKSSSNYAGRLILPLIFTHQGQVNGKTNRNPKVQLAERCYHDAQADGLWVVDKSLADDNGSATLRNKRFPGIIALHEELNERIASKLRIGGPYWGLNLVLWAKGLIDYPVIGVGAGYQFFLSGGHTRTASSKIAIPSLRRRVSVSPKLGEWLDAAIKKLGPAHPAHGEFADLRKRLTILRDPTRAREQVAVFYKCWFDGLASAPKTGRSMALFQDLSAAYALGKSLPAFDDEGTARRPEAIAEPLMLSCL
jgi:hypothetical protein